MALTKKQKSDIETALLFAKRAKKYLQREDVVVASTMMPHALSYYNKDGQGITPMQKFVGSELAYLLNSIERLESILLQEENKKNPQPTEEWV